MLASSSYDKGLFFLLKASKYRKVNIIESKLVKHLFFFHNLEEKERLHLWLAVIKLYEFLQF